MKTLKTNYQTLNELSLADEIALLQFEASVLDGIKMEIMELNIRQSKIPLSIQDSARLRELEAEAPKIGQIVTVLNNRVSNVINSIFSWEDPVENSGTNPLS